VTNLDLRPLSLGEILDRTFSLYRQNFLLFAGIVALPQLPTLALGLVQIQLLRTPAVRLAGQPPPDFANAFSTLGVGSLIAIVFNVVAYLFTHGGTVFAVSELYLGRTTTIGNSLRRMWGKLGSLFVLLLLNFMAIVGALILLVVPGFYVACRLITCVPVALLENLGPGESFSRSFRLTEDDAGRSFVIYLLYYFLLLAAIVLLVYPFTYATVLSARNPDMMRLWSTLNLLGGFFAGVVVAPIFTIAATVFYYDLRVRKEGLDLQLMMDQSGGIAPRTAGFPATLT
jgi:hypothetical protein